MTTHTLNVGQSIRYVDEVRVEHDALVVAIHMAAKDEAGNASWDDEAPYWPSVNVVYVSTDTAKHDPYGQQIERASSVPAEKGAAASGRFWKFA